MVLTGLCNIETKIVTCFGAVKNILFKRCFEKDKGCFMAGVFFAIVRY